MQPFRRYTWPVDQPEPQYPKVWLDDAEYAKAIQSLLVFCVDIVPYHRPSRTLLLAERAQLPMQGLWFIGGRVGLQQTIPEAAVKHFKLDTGLDITFDRLEYLFITDYCWHDRQQTPQQTPSRNMAMTFGLAVTNAEASYLMSADCRLRQPEYFPDSMNMYEEEQLQNLQRFHPVLSDIWQSIFDPTALRAQA